MGKTVRPTPVTGTATAGETPPADPTPEKKPKKKKERPPPPPPGWPRVWYHLKPWVGPLSLFLVLRIFVLGAFHIWPTGSMAPTLLIDDYLFVNKLVYGAKIPFIRANLPAFRAPRWGEIVIFDSPETPGLTVVKRIVGVPGDTLAMVDGVLFRQGQALDEPYTQYTQPPGWDPTEPSLGMRLWQSAHLVGVDPRTYQPDLENWGPILVPPDSFMMMGDNRRESYDSRFWGFLGRDRIEGRPFMIYYSFNRQGDWPLPALTAIRFRRLGGISD